jgi:hypothetical protein
LIRVHREIRGYAFLPAPISANLRQKILLPSDQDSVGRPKPWAFGLANASAAAWVTEKAITRLLAGISFDARASTGENCVRSCLQLAN